MIFSSKCNGLKSKQLAKKKLKCGVKLKNWVIKKNKKKNPVTACMAVGIIM